MASASTPTDPGRFTDLEYDRRDLGSGTTSMASCRHLAVTWNLAGFYEAYGIETRLAAEYVSHSLFGLGGDKSLDTIQDDRLTWTSPPATRSVRTGRSTSTPRTSSTRPCATMKAARTGRSSVILRRHGRSGVRASF